MKLHHNFHRKIVLSQIVTEFVTTPVKIFSTITI